MIKYIEKKALLGWLPCDDTVEVQCQGNYAKRFLVIKNDQLGKQQWQKLWTSWKHHSGLFVVFISMLSSRIFLSMQSLEKEREAKIPH